MRLHSREEYGNGKLYLCLNKSLVRTSVSRRTVQAVYVKIYIPIRFNYYNLLPFLFFCFFLTGNLFAITQKELREAASDLNRDLPQMIDSDTRLNSVMGGPGLRFTYYCTLIHYSSTELSSSQKAEIKRNFRILLKNRLCSDPGLRTFFFKNNVSVSGYYEWADGVFFTEIFVYPSDCGF